MACLDSPSHRYVGQISSCKLIDDYDKSKDKLQIPGCSSGQITTELSTNSIVNSGEAHYLQELPQGIDAVMMTYAYLSYTAEGDTMRLPATANTALGM